MILYFPRSGSTNLLRWLLSVSAATVHSRSSRWNVSNYLRTESEYSAWQFCRCMEVVAGRNDLKLLRWFFRHLKGFHVPVEAVEIAAERGHLEFLQFLLAHDLGRECTRKCTSKTTCDCQCVHECIPQVPEHLRPKGNWVHWAGRSIGLAVDNGHSDVAKWLHEHAPHQSADCEVESIVRKALAVGGIELAEYFRPEGASLLDFAPYCPRLEVIEMMLQSGMLRRNQEYAARAIADLAGAGRLDLIQQLAMHFNQPLVYRGFDWSGSWYSAIKEACLRGDLAMVQWLVEHRKGRQFCRVKMKKDSKHMHFLCYAAGAGSVDVMRFLYDKQYADQFVPALLSAVCKNQLAAVKWLLDHLPAEEQSAASCVIEAAARHGRLEILQYLAKLDAASSWWSPSETAMSLSSAAAGCSG